MKSKEPKSNRMCSVWVHFLKEVFKFGFIEQFEPIGNFCVTLIRLPPSAGATFPQGKASTRKWDLSFITKTMFFFWLQ